MKKIVIGILSFVLISFISCTKELEQIEFDEFTNFTETDFEVPVNTSNYKANLKSNGVPQWRMVALEFSKKDENLAKIVLFDPSFKDYSDLQVQVQITEYSAESNSENKPIVKSITIVKEKDNSSPILRSEPVLLSKSPKNSIVTVSLVYIVGNEKIFSTTFNAFINKNGMGELQQPELRTDNNGLVSGYTFDDAHGLDDSRTLTFEGVNDPAQEVANVSVTIEGKEYSRPPYRRLVKGGFVVIIEGISVDKIAGDNSPPTVDITFYNAQGTQLASYWNFPLTSKGKTTMRGRAMIENPNSGGTSFTFAALLENVKTENFGYVEVSFSEESSELLASSSIFRLRKRPDLLLQEWDQLIDEQLVSIQQNPLAIVANDINEPILFKESVIGKSFSFSATIYNSNGKAISEPQNHTVIAKENPNNAEPKIISTRIFSTDGGKTWTYQVILEDAGQWVEKVQVEFEKNPETPNPVINPFSLSLVGEKEGNIEIYEGNVKFDGDPSGLWYSGKVYQYGTGTRSSAGHANNKAELL